MELFFSDLWRFKQEVGDPSGAKVIIHALEKHIEMGSGNEPLLFSQLHFQRIRTCVCINSWLVDLVDCLVFQL